MKKIGGIFVMMLLITSTMLSLASATNIENYPTEENNENIVNNKPVPKAIFPNIPRLLNKDWNYWADKPDLFLIPTGNVGIGTESPGEKLDVVGTVQMTGFKMLNGASSGYVLTTDSSGVGTWKNIPGGMGGGGTVNNLAKFTASHEISDSIIAEKSGKIGIGTTNPSSLLEVDGIVHSTSGGFKFPDGSIQTSATVAGGINGGGDSGYLSKFTGASTIDNSLVYQKDNKIGLGTTNPEELIHIVNPGDARILFENPATMIKGFELGIDSVGSAYMWNFEDKSLNFGTNNMWRMIIKNDGKVGIGTNFPDEKLHVSGGNVEVDSSYAYQLKHDNGHYSEIKSVGSNQLWISNNAGGEIDFLTGTNPGNVNSKMTIWPSGVIQIWGKVGIGTYNPAYDLDVEGYVQATGYYTGDIIFQKDGQKLWRMYEDIDGLYLESMITGKEYRLVIEETDNSENSIENTVKNLQSENELLKQRIEALEQAIYSK